jgi:hypothetical protein
MSPHLILESRHFGRHPQRPWRPVEHEPRRSAITRARIYAAPVVRELPPRSARQESAGTW